MFDVRSPAILIKYLMYWILPAPHKNFNYSVDPLGYKK